MAIALDTLAYALRLREAGFTEQQAEGQAQALAAAMTDTLATKQDLNDFAMATKQNLRELEVRIDARFAQVDARFAQIDVRFDYLEKHLDTRLVELEKRIDFRFNEKLADLERRMTLRLLTGIAVVSTLVKLL
jgi:predicted  nucleic acid-binding Zn-ribbon protein